MKTYKLWIEIEEWDSETDEHRDVTKSGVADPVPMHVFGNLSDAIEAAESYHMNQDHLRDVTGADLKHPPKPTTKNAAMRFFLVTHQHRHGVDAFLVKSEDRPTIDRIVNAFDDLDYEEDRGEVIEIKEQTEIPTI